MILGSNQSVLVYDIETDGLDVETAKVKWFGAYSMLTQEYYLLPFTDKKEILKLIDNHKVLAGFNNKEFDNPILENDLEVDFEYKVMIDLYQVSKSRLPNMGIKPPSYKLDDIVKTLKLDQKSKGQIDYNIFKKDEWTYEEIKEIEKYLKQDVSITMKLLEWFFIQFKPLRKYLGEKDKNNYADIKASTASLGYRVICNMAGLDAEFTNEEVERPSIAGGHHINPRVDRARGRIISIDFVSAYPHAIMQGNLFSDAREGWSGDGYYRIQNTYNDKKMGRVEEALKKIFIERLKAKEEGDKIKNMAYKIVINCFSEDTNIMTVNGVKKIKDCSVGEKVYSINPSTGETEEKNITKLYSQEYKGSMYHFKTKVSDLMVTPEHELIVEKRDSKTSILSKPHKIQAQNMDTNGYRFVNSKPIKGEVSKFISISEPDSLWCVKLKNPYGERDNNSLYYDTNNRRHISLIGKQKIKGEWFFQNRSRDMWIREKLPIKDFMYFLGMFLGDGSTHIIKPSNKFKVKRGKTYCVNITQSKKAHPEIYNKIERCLDNLNFRYTQTNKGFRICSKTLYDFVSEYKKNSYNITIPKKIFSYNHTILKYLYEGMYDADGSKGSRNCYTTVCEKLKDDFIKLNLHLGYQSNVYCDSGCYRICRQKNRWYKNKKIVKNPTNKVYCLNVEDNHSVLAGRNGRFVWTGQSIYGLTGNPVFKNLYRPHTAMDCTWIVRTWIVKLAKMLEEDGFTVLYGFTDSVMVKIPPHRNSQDLMYIVYVFMNEVKSHLPFPQDTFKLEIEKELKFIWFVAKNCYLWVDNNGEIGYRSTLLNKNTPEIIMKLFDDYIAPKIVRELDVNFTKEEIIHELKKILKDNFDKVGEIYQVKNAEDYKSKTSIQYQIAEFYGEGKHILIPNMKGIGVGKSKGTNKVKGIRYCSNEDFVKYKLTYDDISYDKLLKHIKPFYGETQISKQLKNSQLTIN